jgi:hypothetical protein
MYEQTYLAISALVVSKKGFKCVCALEELRFEFFRKLLKSEVGGAGLDSRGVGEIASRLLFVFRSNTCGRRVRALYCVY